jgi:integrase
LSRYLADELMYWQQQSKYQEANDWVFASPRMHGRYPYWPAMLLTRTIRPAALAARIAKRIGWHTFRHTYSTLLVSNGENVKVIQELMRHASSRSTLEIFSQARNADKRAAQQRVMQMIFPEDLNSNELGTEPEHANTYFDWIN